MKPYYSDNLVTLFLGDCREITEWLAADVLMTDPPYGTNFSIDNPKGGYGRRQNAGLGGFVIANDGSRVRSAWITLQFRCLPRGQIRSTTFMPSRLH